MLRWEPGTEKRILGKTKEIWILYVCVRAKLLQLCLTLCDRMDYSLPGSSVHIC